MAGRTTRAAMPQVRRDAAYATGTVVGHGGENATEMHGTMHGQRAAVSGKVAGAKLVCCMDCAHGPLHRYDNNPVLAACHKKPNCMNERFPYQVEVASVMRRCVDYQKSLVAKVIEQRSKVVA